MKILITGGAGFIGSNLVDHFMAKGLEVVCLDNLSTGFLANISHHIPNSKFKFIQDDIRNFKVCVDSVRDCDLVCHQAALGSVPRSISDPLITNSVNITGFLNVLVASRDEKVKRFVYASSSSTYGDSIKLPKKENEIGSPLSPYSITKLVNELYANNFSDIYNMQCIGLRYFNVFGIRQNPDSAYAAVIPLWAKQLITHESPQINGDGSNSRDFTYIANVVQANEKALLDSSRSILSRANNYYISVGRKVKQKPRKTTSEEAFSEVLNIAFGGRTTLEELFLSLRNSLSKYDPEIQFIEPKYGPPRTGDIDHSHADINKAVTILKYKPDYNVEKGIETVSEWYYKRR